MEPRILTHITGALVSIISFVLGWVVPKKQGLLAIGGRHFGGNTGPVLDQCASHGFEGVWLTRRTEILALNHPKVVSCRSWRGIWTAARAQAVLLTHSLGDFSPLVFPSKSTQLFNLWHGMPIKKISTQDPGFWQRSHAKSNVREMKRYSAVFATSAQMAEFMALTFGLPESRVLMTGQPRNDCLFSAQLPPIDSHYDPPLPPHTKKVLYCPTWRDGTAVRLFPFDDRDDSALQTALEALDAVLFIRTHPNDPGRWKERQGRIVPMQGDVVPEINAALPLFDTLITDYSSIYYDYLMLDRPCIFLPYDVEQYAEAPGFFLPFSNIAAGPCPATQVDFLAALTSALEGEDPFSVERHAIRDMVYADVDGQSTARVLNALKEELM